MNDEAFLGSILHSSSLPPSLLPPASLKAAARRIELSMGTSLLSLPPSLPPFYPCFSQSRGEAGWFPSLSRSTPSLPPSLPSYPAFLKAAARRKIIDGHRLVLLGVVEEGGREGGGEEGREGGGDLFLDGVVGGQVGS